MSTPIKPGDVIAVTLIPTPGDHDEDYKPEVIWVRAHAIEERNGQTVVLYAGRGTPFPLPEGADVADYNDCYGTATLDRCEPVPPVVHPAPFVSYQDPTLRVVEMKGKVAFEDVLVRSTYIDFDGEGKAFEVTNEPRAYRKWTLTASASDEGDGGTVLELTTDRQETDEGYSCSGVRIEEGWANDSEDDRAMAWRIEGGTAGSDCDGPIERHYEELSFGGADPEAPAWFADRSPREERQRWQRDHYAEAMGY